MNESPWPRRISRVLGLLLLIPGLLINKWTLQSLSGDGVIESGLFNAAIFLFNAAFILTGLYLLRKPGRDALINLAFLAGSALVIALLAEFGTRVFLFGWRGLSYAQMRSTHLMFESGLLQPSPIPGAIYEFKPNLDTRYAMAPLRTNPLGMADDPVAPEKSDRELRIACLGDSFTLPAGIAHEQAWHTRLEAELAAQLPERSIQCLNFGVPGYGLPQYRAVLEHKALPMKPDVIVVGFCAENDHIPIPDAYFERALRESRIRNGFWRCTFVELVKFINYQPFYEMDKTPAGEETAYVAEEFQKLAAVAGNIPVLVAYLASVPRDGTPIGEIARSSGLQFVDVARAFEGTALREFTLYHPLDSHPNPAANARFAEEIARALLRKDLLTAGR